MRIFKVLPAAVIAVSLAAGCAQPGQQGPGQKTMIGAAGGAAAGGLLGAAMGGGAKGIAAGVILGGLLGGVVGNMMDNQDRAYQQQAAQYSLQNSPSGTTSSWQNQKSGNSGQFTPTSDTYIQADGRECRNFTNNVTLSNGRTEQVRGTACKNRDGSWEITG